MALGNRYAMQYNANTHAWDVVDRQTGAIVLAGETYAVADGIEARLNYPTLYGPDELSEVADRIREEAKP